MEAFDYIETQFRITKEGDFEVLGFEIHSQFGLESLGKGRYRCSIPADHKEPLLMLMIVHHPGFLQGFYTRVEPEALQQGRVEVRLPKPRTLAIEADVSRAPEDTYHKFWGTLQGGQGDRRRGCERVEPRRTLANPNY